MKISCYVALVGHYRLFVAMSSAGGQRPSNMTIVTYIYIHIFSTFVRMQNLEACARTFFSMCHSSNFILALHIKDPGSSAEGARSTTLGTKSQFQDAKCEVTI